MCVCSLFSTVASLKTSKPQARLRTLTERVGSVCVCVSVLACPVIKSMLFVLTWSSVLYIYVYVYMWLLRRLPVFCQLLLLPLSLCVCRMREKRETQRERERGRDKDRDGNCH